MAAPKYIAGQTVKYLFRQTEIRSAKITAVQRSKKGTFTYWLDGAFGWHKEENLFEILAKKEEAVV